MYRNIRRTAFLIMLSLFGCTQADQTQSVPNPPDTNSNMHEHGGGDGGGGGM